MPGSRFALPALQARHNGLYVDLLHVEQERLPSEDVSVAPPNLAELVRELHNDNAQIEYADVKSGWSATL